MIDSKLERRNWLNVLWLWLVKICTFNKRRGKRFLVLFRVFILQIFLTQIKWYSLQTQRKVVSQMNRLIGQEMQKYRFKLQKHFYRTERKNSILVFHYKFISGLWWPSSDEERHAVVYLEAGLHWFRRKEN